MRTIWIAVLANVLSVSIANGQQIVFEEKFNVPDATALSKLGWQIHAKPNQSLWQIENGTLKITHLQNPYNGGSISHYIPKIRKGALEFDAKLSSQKNYNFNLQVIINGIMTAFFGGNEKGCFWKRYKPGEGWVNLWNGEFDVWHRFKIVFDVDKQKVQYFVDDMLNPVYEEEGFPLKVSSKIILGNYGLTTYGAPINYVDNIRVINLEHRKTNKLIIASYKCTPSPTSGDSSGNVLTDGIIAKSDKDLQAGWKEFTGKVTIELTLEKPSAIGSIILYAYACPARNIAVVKCYAWRNRRWIPIGVINNQYQSQDIEPYSLKLENLNILTNKIKLTIEREIYDRWLYLSEIVLLRPKNVSPKQSSNISTDLNKHKTITLANDNISYRISLLTGQIVEGLFKPTNFKAIVGGEDQYVLLTRSDTRQFREGDDRVIKKTHKANELILACKNHNMSGIKIIKEYQLKNNILIKKVTIHCNKEFSPATFVTFVSSLKFSPTITDSGVYIGRDGFGDPKFCKDVKFLERASTRLGNKMLLLVNREKNLTVAHYRYMRNGKYLLPWGARTGADAPYFMHNGWKMGMFTDKLIKANSTSVTMHYVLMKGTEIDFWKFYRQLPEVKKFYEKFVYPRADWVKDVKAIFFPAYSAPMVPGKCAVGAKTMINLFDEGYIITCLWPFGVWGDFDQTETYNVFGGLMTADRVRKEIEKLHRVSDRIKVGIYTFQGNAQECSKVFQKHPEFFATVGRSGEKIARAGRQAPSYPWVMSAPGAIEYRIKQYHTLMSRYNLDLHYLDGGSKSDWIDWGNERMNYDADGQKFLANWRIDTKKFGRDKALFFNARITPLADCGFIELPYGKISGNWRDAAGVVYGPKVMQSCDISRWNSILYWSEKHEPFYCNYMIGLGFKPAHAFAPWAVPYIRAAYETRFFKIIEAELKPFWLADSETNLETYLLKQGNAVIVSIINHNPSAKKATVSFNAVKAGLDTQTDIYCWEMRLRDSRKSKFIACDANCRKIYRKTNWRIGLVGANKFSGKSVPLPTGRIKQTITLNSQPVLEMLTFSNSPAVVYSVNYLPLNFCLPTTMGVKVSGRVNRDKHTIELKTISSRKTTEIISYVPQNWAIKNVRSNNRELTYKLIPINGQNFVLIAIPKGKYKITINCKAYNSLGKFSIDVPKKISAGEKLSIIVTSRISDKKPIFINIFNEDGTLVFADSYLSKTGKIAIKLPKSLWGGKYTLEASLWNSKPVRKTIIITDTAPLRYPYAKDLPTQPPVKKIKKVNKNVNTAKVLRTATETYEEVSGATYGHYANVKIADNRIILSAGNHLDSQSRHGYANAGIEFDNAKFVELDITNKFANAIPTAEMPMGVHALTIPYYAGIVLDYETEKNNTARVYLTLGICAKPARYTLPTWPKPHKPIRIIELKDIINNNTKQVDFVLDISKYAPDKWTGKCWLSVVNQHIFPGRGFDITVRFPKGEGIDRKNILSGTDVTALYFPRKIICPKINEKITIDGKLNERIWKRLTPANDFRKLSTGQKPSQSTKAMVCWNSKNLYAAFVCNESKKAKLFVSNDSKTAPWGDDSVELFLDTDFDHKTYYHIVVSCNGNYYVGKNQHKVNLKLKAKANVELTKKKWTVEICIPFTSLKSMPKNNSQWGINFCRNKPTNTGGIEYMMWSGFYCNSFHSPQNFGIMKFKE